MNINETREQIFKLEGALSLLTHHDALPGTGLFNVTTDYIKKTEKQIENMGKILGNLFTLYFQSFVEGLKLK